MRYIDSHIHFDQYHINEQEIILKAENKPDFVFACGMDIKGNEKTLRLSQKYAEVKVVLGLHPEVYNQYDELNQVKEQIESNIEKIAAIGEIGMPYYALEEVNEDDKERIIKEGKRVLCDLLDLAKRYDKPVVLHVIFDHVGYVLNELKKREMKKVMFHWFEGSDEDLQTIIEEGYYMSVSPEVLYDHKYADFVAKIPLDLMLLESDGPWPYNEVKGEPKMILQVIDFIAKKRKLSKEKLSEQIYLNTKKCFNIK